MQVETVEHRMPVLVTETHAGQPYVAADGLLEPDRMAWLAKLRLRLQHLRDACARSDRLLECGHALPEHAQRPDEIRDVRVEREE